MLQDEIYAPGKGLPHPAFRMCSCNSARDDCWLILADDVVHSNTKRCSHLHACNASSGEGMPDTT